MNEDIPLEYKCPICFEIPENEIYQCVSGHTICDTCSITLNECPQCRVKFEGPRIRNRALESLLDKVEFECPFKSKGCNEKVARKEFRAHEDSCSFGTHGIKLCKQLGFPCQFILDPNDITVSLAHLLTNHGFIICHNDQAKISLNGLVNTELNYKSFWNPIIFDLRKSTGFVWILIHLFDNKNKSISPICIKIGERDMDESSSEKFKPGFFIKSNKISKIPDIEWSSAFVDMKHAHSVIQHPPIGLDLNTLKLYAKDKSIEINCSLNMKPATIEDAPVIQTVNSAIIIPQILSAVEPSAPISQMSGWSPFVEDQAPQQGPPQQYQNTLGTHLTAFDGDIGTTDKHMLFGYHCDVCKHNLVKRFKCLYCREFDLCGACMRNGEHKHHVFAVISNKKQEKFLNRILGKRGRVPFLDTERLTQPPLEILPVVRCSQCSQASVYICLFCWPLFGYCDQCFQAFSTNHVCDEHVFGVANTPGNMQLISWVLNCYRSHPQGDHRSRGRRLLSQGVVLAEPIRAAIVARPVNTVVQVDLGGSGSSRRSRR